MKTILITGCSSGFGKEMSEHLAGLGFHVLATMRNADSRQDLFSDLDPDIRKNISIFNLDVTSLDDVEKLYNDLLSRKINIDVLINNAGYGIYGALEELSLKQAREQMEVNYFGLIQMIQTFLPMLRQSKGKIINISSLMGEFSMPLGSVYSASKYAVEGITEGLAYELRPYGVQATSILPGGHRTGFIDAIKWTEGQLEQSIYKGQMQAMAKMMNDVKDGKMVPQSSNISKLIVKIIARKNVSRRYYLGADAVLGHYSRRILPDFIYYFIMNFLYKRMVG